MSQTICFMKKTEQLISELSAKPVLQIRKVKRDNLGIFSHIPPKKYIFCDPPLEPSRRDGSNEGSQHMFLLRNKKIIFELSLILPLIWSPAYLLYNI